MKFNDLLADAYGRIQERVHNVLDGLDADQLAARPGGDSNSIAWLVWHLTRIQDDHIADVAGTGQYWLSGWAERFDLPLEREDHGYGHSPEQVAAVRVESPDLLRSYYDDVHAGTLMYLAGLTEDDLDRIVDTNWDPHVSLGVRLISVLDDCLEHIGQAAYVKGMLKRGEACGVAGASTPPSCSAAAGPGASSPCCLPRAGLGFNELATTAYSLRHAAGESC